MTRIRALRQGDLPQVVALYRSYLAWPHVADGDELIAAFGRIFLDGPRCDPDIPSRVLEGADGEVLGFIGSLVHRMRFEDRPVRLACSSSLVVAPRARQIGAGALLLRRHLAGPQDLTITDTAGGATERMWKGFGGFTHHMGSITWLHPMRPLRMAVGLGLWRMGRPGMIAPAGALCRPLDALYARWDATGAARGSGDASDEPLAPKLLIDHLRIGPQRFRLWPDHDPASLDELFDEIHRSRANGRLVKRFVRGARGEPLGWYILSLLPNGICYVLHLAAAPGSERLLLEQVLRTAREISAAAVAGRLEPWVLEVLPSRTVMFSRVKFLVHSRDQALCDAVRAGEALLTGLESDIWMPR